MDQQLDEKIIFNKIFNDGPTAMAVIGPDYKFLMANNILGKILDYPKKELKSMTFLDITYDDDTSMVKSLLKKIFSGKIPYYDIENRATTKNKKTIWLKSTVTAIRNNNRVPPYAHVLIENINDRKVSEEKSQDLIKWQETIIDNIPVLQYNVSPDGIILNCNKLVLDTLGYKNKDELIGKPLAPTIYTPAFIDKSKKLFLKWKKTGTVKDEELQIKTKNGKVIDVLLNVSTLYDNDGKILSSISTQLDITTRIKAEKEIENLSRFPSENPNPVLRIDKTGIVIYSNQVGIKMLKKLKSKLGGKAPKIFNDTVTRLLKEKSPKPETANIHLGEMEYEFVITPVKGTDYINLYGRDVTERKKAEKAIESLSRFPSENPNPVFRVNNKFSILYANESARKILQELDNINGDKILKILSGLAAGTKKTKIPKLKTVELEINDSIYEFSVIPVKDTDYFNIYGKNITEEKKAESLHRGMEREKAAIDERNRLARDLHDTVTQTLYSANLIAGIIPRLWKRNPKDAVKRLEEIRLLNNVALTEMRVLIFELRPSSFIEENLGTLLKELAKSTSARSKIPIRVQVDGKCKFSPKTELGLYRITQEALNNIVKHSFASRANIFLKCDPEILQLQITDNGNGFDTTKISKTNLGLTIIKERAKLIGASIKIDSRPGSGTEISVSYSDPK